MYNVTWSFYRFKADPQKCYEEIGEDKNITPKRLLEIASDESTELHKCFTWDDTEASRKWRLQEAKLVIRSFVVRPIKEETCHPQRVFQISSERNVYQPISFFVQNKDEHQKLIDRAFGELRAFKNRYNDIAELEEVIEVIDRTI